MRRSWRDREGVETRAKRRRQWLLSQNTVGEEGEWQRLQGGQCRGGHGQKENKDKETPMRTGVFEESAILLHWPLRFYHSGKNGTMKPWFWPCADVIALDARRRRRT